MTEIEKETSDLYVKCFTLQLDEMEFLSAAFAANEEFRNLDECLVQEMRIYINGVKDNPTHASVPDRLLNFTISPTWQHGDSHKYEMTFELPHFYPVLENVNVILHSPVLNQTKELIFKTQFQKYVQTLEREEPHIYVLFDWMRDFVEQLLKREAGDVEREAAQLRALTLTIVNFERLWIYSHHIKSSMKRQYILQTAKELQLSGFSLVGKPGIICVEGMQENTQQFWREIKALNWQKITLRKIETKSSLSCYNNNQSHWKRFSVFTEFIQSSIENAKTHAYINMRDFLEFLNEHKSGYMKKELFGFD